MMADAPMPDVFMIPQAVLDQWGNIPPSDRVSAPLTRSDVDHLLLGLLRVLESQKYLDQALTDWSNGRLDGANQAINTSRKINMDAQNSIRQFASALMSSAIRERGNG